MATAATALPETGWRQTIQSKMKAWMPSPVESSGEQQQVGQAGSVLAAWRSYASSTRGGSDVASAAANPSSTGRDLESAVPESLAPLLKSANNTIVGAFNSVTKGVRELPGNVQAAASFVPSRQAVTCFAIMTAAGVFFILMAFFMFLPVIVLFPQKFAISFTLGCLFIIGSFFALKGPKTQFLHMISKERLPFTAGFLGSMAATIYVSMVLHSYIFSVVCAAVQVLALLYYVLSYFPGGTAGMQFVTSLITSSVLKCFGR
jgi:hypothetical protein